MAGDRFYYRMFAYVGTPAYEHRPHEFTWTERQRKAEKRLWLRRIWDVKNGRRLAYGVNMHLLMRRLKLKKCLAF